MKKLLLALLALFPAGLAVGGEVTGKASWYGHDYDGKIMANGQPFDATKLTLATYEFPLGSVVEIEYVSKSGQRRKAHGTVTDRGPHVRGRKFDLSRALFKKLESVHAGVIEVTVRRIA